MKTLHSMLILMSLSSTSAFGACLQQPHRETDYFTLTRLNRCTSKELEIGKVKMQSILKRAQAKKSYEGREAEKALAELSLYNIKYELAMRSKK